MTNLWLLSHSFVRAILCRVLGGVLDKVLYGEALPGGLSPYP